LNFAYILALNIFTNGASMNSQDQQDGNQNNPQNETRQSRKGAKEHLRDLQNAITPSGLTALAVIGGFAWGGLHGGLHRLIRRTGTNATKYALENAAEFKDPVYNVGRVTADAFGGFQLQRGWQPSSNPLPFKESLAYTLAYLYASGIGVNLLKQIASLPTNAAGLWDEITLNNIVTKSPIFLALGLAVSYRVSSKGSAKIKDEEQPQNVHDLFKEGMDEYDGQLTHYLASLVAKGKGIEMPEDLSEMKFFEQHGVGSLANDIIQAGKADLDNDLHNRLQSFIKTVNQTGAISSDDESYPTITDYLVDYEPLTAYLRDKHPEVVLVREQEQLESAKDKVTTIIKNRKLASDSEIEKMAESRKEATKLLVGFVEIRRELEKLDDQQLDSESNLKVFERLTTLIDYELEFHNQPKESTRKVIRGYIASLPTMEAVAKDAEKPLRDFEWEPLGVKEHKARTNFNVLARPAGGACLTRRIDANPITGQTQVLKLVTADTSQIAESDRTSLRAKGQGYIKINQAGAIELSSQRAPRNIVWAELIGEMKGLQSETKPTVQTIGRRMIKLGTEVGFVFGIVTDAHLQSTRAMEAELASLIDKITTVEQEIEKAFSRFKDKTKDVVEQYKKAKTIANESRQYLKNAADGLKVRRRSGDAANISNDMLLLNHKYDSELERGIAQKVDAILADESGRWFATGYNTLPSLINTATNVQERDLQQAIRSSNFDAALEVSGTCAKYYEHLIEHYKNSPPTQKVAQDTYSYYKTVAVNCHVQSALRKVGSINIDNAEAAEQLVNLKNSLQLISNAINNNFVSFDNNGQVTVPEKERMPKTRKTILEALAIASAILSKDFDALNKIISSDTVKIALHDISQHARDMHAQLNDVLRLHDSVEVSSTLQARLLRAYRLDKFTNQQTSKVNIEAQLEAAERIDTQPIEKTKPLESAQSNISPEEQKQLRETEKRRLKAEKKKARKAEKAAAEQLSSTTTVERAASASTPPAQQTQKDTPRRQQQSIATESAEERQQRFEQLRDEIIKLENQLPRKKEDFNELETEFLTLKNAPTYRANFSKEDLREKAAAYRDAAVSMVGLYSQLSAKYSTLIGEFPERSSELNSGLKVREYRSEREPCRFKAREGDALANTWYQEKAKVDIQETKTQLALRPTEALIDLLSDEEITSVTSTVGKWHGELLDHDKERAQSQLAKKQGISLADYQAQFTGEYGSKNESLYDHLIEKTIILRAEEEQAPVEIKGHDHYPLPEMGYVPVVDLIEKHQGNRTFCSLQSRGFASIGRAEREALGWSRQHGELSERTVQRLERLEVVTTLLNNPKKFGLGPSEIAFIEKARTDKSVLSPGVVVNLLTIVHRHEENGCKIHLWEPTNLSTKPLDSTSRQIDHSDFLNGTVVGADPHNDLCLINKTGGIMEPKLSGSQEYFLAKKSVFGGAVKGDKVSCAKGQIKKNGVEIGHPATSIAQKPGAKRLSTP